MKKIILLFLLLCISSIHPNVSTPVYAEEIREEQSYLDLSKTTYSIVLDGNGSSADKIFTLSNSLFDKGDVLSANCSKNTEKTNNTNDTEKTNKTHDTEKTNNTHGKNKEHAKWKEKNINSICKKAFQSVEGDYSVSCLSLKDNQFYSKNNHKQQAASLIKLFIAGAVYENIENIDANVQYYLESMITVSDNDAANALVSILGAGDVSKGMAKVNAYCEKYEYDMTHMGRLLLSPNTKDDNYTSVNDCAHFLEKVYNHTIPGAEKIEQLLLQQKRVSKIPAGIPKGIKVGNKTGELGNVENDAAIIYLEKKPYILCVMCENLTNCEASRMAIVNLSKELLNYIKKPY